VSIQCASRKSCSDSGISSIILRTSSAISLVTSHDHPCPLTPEQSQILELAFNCTLRKLGLVDRDDLICEIVAERMIDIYKRGVTDAVALSEITLREIGLPEL
jgi:hypothetical protein